MQMAFVGLFRSLSSLPFSRIKDAVQLSQQASVHQIRRLLHIIDDDALMRQCVELWPYIRLVCRPGSHSECTGVQSAMLYDDDDALRTCFLVCTHSLIRQDVAS